MANQADTQLERIAAGKSNLLELEHLSDAARSLKQLTALIEWLREHDAHLVASDVRLDTRRADGRQMVALLQEIARWERDPERPRGRPGLLASDPNLAETITRLRKQGYSLSRIAHHLNQEGIPTPRGGVEWRASSVQAALGYRRPPPPPLSAPKPPGPPPPPPPPPKPRPKPKRPPKP